MVAPLLVTGPCVTFVGSVGAIVSGTSVVAEAAADPLDVLPDASKAATVYV